MPDDPTNATLIARHDLTDVLSVVQVRPDSGVVPPFVPGQFFRLGLPRAEAAPNGRPTTRPGRVRYTRRAYSVASAATVTDYAEFFVVRVEQGALTPRLWELQIGARLWMDDQAKGEFRLDLAPPGCDMVMVSTGTGIAPFLSMLRTYWAQKPWRRFVLINGVRRPADLGYRDELEQISRQDHTVIYLPLVSRATDGDGWNGLRGRVQTVLAPDTYQRLVGAPLEPHECHVFLCGNPAMIDDVVADLLRRGFVCDDRGRRGNIHFERYW